MVKNIYATNFEFKITKKDLEEDELYLPTSLSFPVEVSDKDNLDLIVKQKIEHIVGYKIKDFEYKCCF